MGSCTTFRVVARLELFHIKPASGYMSLLVALRSTDELFFGRVILCACGLQSLCMTQMHAVAGLRCTNGVGICRHVR
jgi:hypothetical protein